MKLKRLGPGQYRTPDDRYDVTNQPGLTECDHPMCDPLHRRFWTSTGDGRGAMHWIEYPCWHVWDNTTDDYAEGCKAFDTKSEAVEALTSILNEERSPR